jgi:hypothetical protein
LCISGEKCLQTLWNDIPSEFEGIQYLNLTHDTIWNPARDREMHRLLAQAGDRRIQEGQSKETVAKEYLTRAKITAEDQYVSLRSAISKAIQREGWKVEQISFITGARSVNKQDLRKNLKFFELLKLASKPYIRN